MFLAIAIGLLLLLGLPTGFFLTIFLTSVFSVVYLKIYSKKVKDLDLLCPIQNTARKVLAKMYVGQAKLWHDYEVIGLENIPKTGSALMVYYHGAFSMDIYYFTSYVLMATKRVVRGHVAPFLLQVPGMNLVLKLFGCFSGGRERCIEVLKEGHLVSLSPGGVREALFSDHNYSLMWNSRRGFAAVALQAKVPIIPFFTENLREAVRRVETGKSFMRVLFEKKQFCSVPVYGGFPVKLRAFIGEPIPYDPNITEEELVEKVKTALEALISKHQRIPGSITHALKQRWDSSHPGTNCKCN